MGIYRQDQAAYQKSSFFCDIRLKNESGEPLRLSSDEKIIFCVKSSFMDDNALVEKVLTADDEINGVYPIMLTPEEMDALPGRYWYDIGIQFPDGSFIRAIPKSAFIIHESYAEKEAT